MKGLIKNEMIKTYRTGFIKAALCVILVFTIALPLGCRIINSTEEYYNNSYDELAENETDAVGKEYYKTYDRVEDFFEDNKIRPDSDWRYNEYYSSVLSLEMSKTVCSLAKQGFKKNEVENYFMYEEMNSDVSLDDDMYVVNSEENNKDVFTLTPEELDEKIASLDSMLTKLKDYILKLTIYDYYETNVRNYKENLELIKEELAQKEAVLKQSPENAKAEYERDQAKADIKSAEIQLWGAEYLKNNKCEYFSWQYNTVNYYLDSAASSYVDCVIMNEKLFAASPEKSMFKTYDEYLEFAKAAEKKCDEAVAIAKYSLENNIPLPECEDDSARDGFLSDAKFLASVVEILMVAIACTILYNEYSTGSIRLLLIRPKSRSKILASKLLTVIIYGAAAMAASMVILFILDSLLHTDKDMSVPYLMMNGSGEVIRVNSVLYVIINIAAKMFSAFVIVSAAFMISALFSKGGIFALMFGASSICGTPIMTLICSEFGLKKYTVYTVLPYLDLSQYIGNAVSGFGDGSLTDMLLGVAGTEAFNPGIGAILCAVHIALFLVIAFFGFKKKQIKN